MNYGKKLLAGMVIAGSASFSGLEARAETQGESCEPKAETAASSNEKRDNTTFLLYLGTSIVGGVIGAFAADIKPLRRLRKYISDSAKQASMYSGN